MPRWTRPRAWGADGADFCLEWDASVDEIVALLKENNIRVDAGHNDGALGGVALAAIGAP
jgi:hypothetical protein